MNKTIGVMIKSGLFVGAMVVVVVFGNFLNEARYLHLLYQQRKNTGDIIFLKRTVSALKTEYENLSREMFDSKTSADFVANLPVLAEFSGISQFAMQSKGSKADGRREVMTVELVLEGRFAAIASFIDILERARLPIQIETLVMESSPRLINASMTIKIYYRR